MGCTGGVTAGYLGTEMWWDISLKAVGFRIKGKRYISFYILNYQLRKEKLIL